MVVDKDAIACRQLIKPERESEILHQLGFRYRLIYCHHFRQVHAGIVAQVPLWLFGQFNVNVQLIMSQFCSPINVGRMFMSIVNFNRNYICTLSKPLIVQNELAISSRCRSIRSRECFVGNCTFWHKISTLFMTINIDDTTVIHITSKQIGVLIFWCILQFDSLAEVICWAFIIGIITIIKCGLVVSRAVYTHIAVAKRCISRIPRREIVGQNLPSLAIKRTLIIVVPSVVCIKDIDAGTYIAVPNLLPSHETIACRSLCSKNHRCIERALKAACRHFLTICQDSCSINITAQLYFDRIL